jgi:hypothetical protein
MHQYRFLVARAGFVLLFLGITFIQVLSFPGQFAHMGKTQGISLAFEVALTLVVGLWLLCGQVALVFLWKIVGAMNANQFYSKGTFGWIERLLWTLKLSCLIPLLLFMMTISQADDPGFYVLLSVVTLFIFSLTAMTSLLKDQIEIKIEP